MRDIPITRTLGAAALLVGALVAVIATATLWPTEAARETFQTIEETGVGEEVSGLPVPRFVSLKNGLVNARRGPGRDYPIAFQFQRAALPVEIIREFENWRLIRDSEGEEGWVFHSLLSGTRTAIVAPWDRDETLRPLRADPAPDAAIEAQIEPLVVVAVGGCDGTWCAVEVDGHRGYVEQDQLWGVYPKERID